VKKHSVIQWVSTLTLSTFAAAAFAAIPSKKLSQFPEGERLIYTRIVDAFHKNSLDEVVRQRALLERNYPLSIHLDNAYYLTGMLEFQSGRFGEALKSFDVVRDRYEKSNKRPAALFGIAMTYQRLNLQEQARRVFDRIMKEYPGSPESQRAWMNVRMEKEVKVKR
jgi:outer membrane protein assembly factor BamD (BamD/ComL family)